MHHWLVLLLSFSCCRASSNPKVDDHIRWYVESIVRETQFNVTNQFNRAIETMTNRIDDAVHEQMAEWQDEIHVMQGNLERSMPALVNNLLRENLQIQLARTQHQHLIQFKADTESLCQDFESKLSASLAKAREDVQSQYRNFQSNVNRTIKETWDALLTNKVQDEQFTSFLSLLRETNAQHVRDNLLQVKAAADALQAAKMSYDHQLLLLWAMCLCFPVLWMGHVVFLWSKRIDKRD